MISVYSNTSIYILAPANSASGGPEALHQLGYYLKEEGFTVSMSYYRNSDEPYDSPVHAKYRQYDLPYCTIDSIPDMATQIVISPESVSQKLHKFVEIQKVIWWLSVGFYKDELRNSSPLKLLTHTLQGRFSHVKALIRSREEMYRFNDDTITNFTASHYAYDFVTSHGAAAAHLIEPLGLDFIQNVLNTTPASLKAYHRKDQILYNPAKKSPEMNKLLSGPLADKFVPLQGYSPTQLIELMKTSKLYIDFGKFPGPERLPKEAVVCGTLILTGTRGASAYDGDVRIPKEYKIVEFNCAEVEKQIEEMLRNYDSHIGNFEEYRQMVYNLEQNFRTQINTLFTRVEESSSK